jgi:hypothetical protein
LTLSAELPPPRSSNQGSSSAPGPVPRPGANRARAAQLAEVFIAVEAARVAAAAASANMPLVLAAQERLEAVTKENVARLQSIRGDLERKPWGFVICCAILATIAMVMVRRHVQ